MGDYVCLDVAAAKVKATNQGLVITWQGGTPADTNFVEAQNPAFGREVAPGSPILLTTVAAKPASCP